MRNSSTRSGERLVYWRAKNAGHGKADFVSELILIKDMEEESAMRLIDGLTSS